MRIADHGPADDPAYQRLIECVSQTLVDVGLADDGGEASTMRLADEDRHGLVYVLFDRSYLAPEFTDAIRALLGSRAPVVSWYVVPDEEANGTTVIGAYPATMPAQAVTLVT